jgi:hypothetical protein
MNKNDCCNENGRCHCNVWKCIGWGVLGVLGFAVIAVLIGIAIMAIWNWIIPGLFSLPVISFYQALGLAVLSRLLFGGCGSGFRKMHRKYHGHKCGCGCGCHGGSNKECCSDNECCSDKRSDSDKSEQSDPQI